MSYLFTTEGFEKIKTELKIAEEKRPGIVKELARAREMGDLSENGAYKGAKFALSDLDRKIRHLKHLITYSKVIEKPKNNEFIGFGHKVVLRKIS